MTATVGYATLRQRKQLHLFFDVSMSATHGDRPFYDVMIQAK